MAESKSLKTAVVREVKVAEKDAKTGNEQTIDEGPDTLKEAATGENIQDLPTGARSHQG